MNDLKLLFITVIPVFLICLIFYLIDKEKESTRIISKMFLVGSLSTLLILGINNILKLVFPYFNINLDNYNAYSIINLFCYFFIFNALVEEGCKWFLTFIVGTKDEEYNEPYDAILYSVLVSLGFALIENVGYVFSFGYNVAFYRMISAVPAHAIFAIYMGYFMGKSRCGYSNLKIYSLLIQTILHGLYNIVAIKSPSIIYIIFYLIFILIIGIYLIIDIRKDKFKVKSKKYCLTCGKLLNNNICECCHERNDY